MMLLLLVRKKKEKRQVTAPQITWTDADIQNEQGTLSKGCPGFDTSL